MTHIWNRWLPLLARASAHGAALVRGAAREHRDALGRRAALGVAGLALVGSAVGAGAVTTDAVAADRASADTVASQERAPATSAAKPATAARPGGTAPTAMSLKHDFQFQSNYYYCGPAATRIVLSAEGHRPSQDELARKLGTTTSGTDSAEDTTRVLNSVTKSDVYRTTSIPGPAATAAEKERLRFDVVNAISKGRAVLVNIAGTATDTEGGMHSFPGGHYLGVVGYGDHGRVVRIADSADFGGDGSYWMKTADLADWIATRGYSA